MAEKVIIYLPNDPEPVAEALSQTGSFEPIIVSDAAGAFSALHGATGLVVGAFNYRSLFPEIEHKPTSLKWIQSAGSGYDMFEKLGVPHGVSFMRAVGIWGHSVAGHAVALTMALMRNLPKLIDAQQQGHWARSEAISNMRSVAGRRIVILGYGDIGQIIASTFKALGADLHIVASRARTGPAGEKIFGLDSLDALLPDAEAVVMSLPTTPETLRLMNANRIALMHRDAVIVNVGRGETVDTSALITALSMNLIGGAGLDVFEQEPLHPDSPLWKCPNLILTPHVANFGDRRSAEKLGALTVRNAEKMARGEAPEGLVAVRVFNRI